VAAAVKHQEKHTMADPMRIRAMENGGTTDVKILMKHDMEPASAKTRPARSYRPGTSPT